MVKLSNDEIDMLFEKSARPGVSGGIGVPIVSGSNTNLEPNMFNITRDDNIKMKQSARRKTLQRDVKVNGAMADGTGAGAKENFQEFMKGVKKGFTGTVGAIAPTVLDVGTAFVPELAVGRTAIKRITGLGQNTNYNVEKDESGKQSLKKELGITGAGSAPKWNEFVKAVKDVSGLKFSDALKVASHMKRNKMYKMADVNQQNVTMIAKQIL